MVGNLTDDAMRRDERGGMRRDDRRDNRGPRRDDRRDNRGPRFENRRPEGPAEYGDNNSGNDPEMF